MPPQKKFIATYIVPGNARPHSTALPGLPSSVQQHQQQVHNATVVDTPTHRAPISLGLNQLNGGMGLNGKGNERATDFDRRNDASSSNTRSRDRPCKTKGPASIVMSGQH
jgi:hypothetical protein